MLVAALLGLREHAAVVLNGNNNDDWNSARGKIEPSQHFKNNIVQRATGSCGFAAAMPQLPPSTGLRPRGER